MLIGLSDLGEVLQNFHAVIEQYAVLDADASSLVRYVKIVVEQAGIRVCGRLGQYFAFFEVLDRFWRRRSSVHSMQCFVWKASEE